MKHVCCTQCGAKPKQGTTNFRFFRRNPMGAKLHICDGCKEKEGK